MMQTKTFCAQQARTASKEMQEKNTQPKARSCSHTIAGTQHPTTTDLLEDLCCMVVEHVFLATFGFSYGSQPPQSQSSTKLEEGIGVITTESVPPTYCLEVSYLRF